MEAWNRNNGLKSPHNCCCRQIIIQYCSGLCWTSHSSEKSSSPPIHLYKPSINTSQHKHALWFVYLHHAVTGVFPTFLRTVTLETAVLTSVAAPFALSPFAWAGHLHELRQTHVTQTQLHLFTLHQKWDQPVSQKTPCSPSAGKDRLCPSVLRGRGVTAGSNAQWDYWPLYILYTHCASRSSVRK